MAIVWWIWRVVMGAMCGRSPNPGGRCFLWMNCMATADEAAGARRGADADDFAGTSSIREAKSFAAGLVFKRLRSSIWQTLHRPLPSARSAAAGTDPQGRLQPPSPLRRMGVQPSASNTVFNIGEAQPFSSSNQNLKSSRPNPSTIGWPESHETKWRGPMPAGQTAIVAPPS